MVKERKEQPKDQEKISKCMHLIAELTECNAEFEGCHWLSAFNTAYAMSMEQNGITYEQYCQEMDNMKAFYKRFWTGV